MGVLATIRTGIGAAAAGLGRNLLSALILAVLLPAGRARFRSGLSDLFVLLAVLWCLAAAGDLVDARFNLDPDAWGIVSEAARGYLWLTVFGVIVLIDARAHDFLRLAVPATAVSVVIEATWLISSELWLRFNEDTYFRWYEQYLWLLIGWSCLVFARVLGAVYGASPVRRLPHTALYAAALVLGVYVLPDAAIFYPDFDEPSVGRVDVESVYYSQPNLLGQALHDLAPERPERRDVYFVGFAGYATEDVFKREIEQARTIVEERFDAAGRSLTLINNPATLQTLPLANRHNLARALNQIAAKMDTDQDLLFLFLTSHGNDDATISVRFPTLGLNDLGAYELREALDESGIRWRIVVISACYSGSFIEALESDETLIITAAAADRTSFGCAHENYWTYFGRAFFDEALRQTRDLRSAFELARARVDTREREENKEPSKPQISVGPAIERVLTDYLAGDAPPRSGIDWGDVGPAGDAAPAAQSPSMNSL